MKFYRSREVFELLFVCLWCIEAKLNQIWFGGAVVEVWREYYIVQSII